MLPKNSVLLLVSNLMIAVKVSGDISEFRLHELDEYNEMIGCLSTFKDDFVTCNQHIKNLGHTVYNLFPENSTLGKAIKCCGIWMPSYIIADHLKIRRDCWYKSAVKNCPKSQLFLIHKMPHKLLPFLHIWCDEWTDDSFVCRLPGLWPLFVTILALIVLCTAIACAICVIRIRKSRSPKKRNTDIEAHSEDNKTINNNVSESDSDDETQH